MTLGPSSHRAGRNTTTIITVTDRVAASAEGEVDGPGQRQRL
jgi:hypothetical protein